MGRALGPAEEPHVEVGAAVAPSMHVDAADVAGRPDGPLDPHDHAAQAGSLVVRQLLDVDVGSRLEEDQDHGSWGPGAYGPRVVVPDELLDGSGAPTRCATGVTLPDPLFAERWWLLHPQVSLEREERERHEVGDRQLVALGGHRRTVFHRGPRARVASERR